MEEHEGLKIPSVLNRVQVQVLSELQLNKSYLFIFRFSVVKWIGELTPMDDVFLTCLEEHLWYIVPLVDNRCEIKVAW